MGFLKLTVDGRINSADFLRASMILILIGFLINVPELLGIRSDSLEVILGIIGLGTLYPWVYIWIKRYHDGGHSGWMCLIFYVLGVILVFGFPDGKIVVIESWTLELANVVISIIIAFGFNIMIKRDNHENQYGPAS